MRNFLKLNTSLNSANTLLNLAESVMRLYSKTFFSKAFKVLADFNKLFNFEKFLIYVLPKI